MKPIYSIHKHTLARVHEHALESYGKGLPTSLGFEGEEACGVLVGPADSPSVCDGVVPFANLANKYHQSDSQEFARTGRTYFLIDPFKFAKAYELAQVTNRPFKILYHSHLDCGAYFSQTDKDAALAGADCPPYALAYLVVSVRGDGHGQGARIDEQCLYLWNDEQREFVETPFEILDESETTTHHGERL